MKVFLDDIRPTPTGWVRTYMPKDTIELLKTGEVTELSLDHDLGDTSETGYDVLLWIEGAVVNKGFVPPNIFIHSDNPPARSRMEAAVESINRSYIRRMTMRGV